LIAARGATRDADRTAVTRNPWPAQVE